MPNVNLALMRDFLLPGFNELVVQVRQYRAWPGGWFEEQPCTSPGEWIPMQDVMEVPGLKKWMEANRERIEYHSMIDAVRLKGVSNCASHNSNGVQTDE